MKHSPTISPINQDYHSNRCFEQLRKSILLRTLHPKVILLASTLEQEGCSTIASHLAIALAEEQEKKVLLVDANLRHPEIHKLSESLNGDGFIELVNGTAKLGDVIQPTTRENISVIPSGQEKCKFSQIFNEERLKPCITQLREHADYVIIDGAPLGKFSDSYFLAGVADGVALVVYAGSTRWEAVKEVKQRLEDEANANILGVILNRTTNPIPNFIYSRM